MEILLLLLLGGGIAFCWSRIDRLERRVDQMTDQIVLLTEAGLQSRREEAEPTRSEAVPASRVEATPIKEPEAPPKPELQPEPEPDPQPAPEPVVEQPVAVQAYSDDTEEALQEGIEPKRGFSFDFEDIFGRRLPIWGGGFALAIAGIFLVRFSIEAGLLTAGVRVVMSFLFGLALLGGAEAAYRFEERVRDPRVRQSLAGAGLATLYGAFYLAGTAYDLIGPGFAFIGLAAVTATAIALSFRFGLPSAVIGLVGGFAAPLLVNSDSSNVPLLSFYLALVTGGLAWAGQAQGRNWLGLVALAGGLGWGALMIFAGVDSSADFAAVGAYLVVLGTVLPAFLRSKGGPRLPVLAAGAIATLQMAVLVSSADFAPLTWGLYLLIGAALAGLGWRFAELRPGTLVAAGLGLWLLFIWPSPDTQFFAIVAVAQVAIFAGVPLLYQWLGRAGLLDLAQLSLISMGVAAAVYVRFGGWGDPDVEPLLGACLGGLALLPIAAFVPMWRREEEGATRMALTLLGPAFLLAFASLLVFSPSWLAPAMAMVATLPLLWLYTRRERNALQFSVWAGAAITVLALMLSPHFESEAMRLGDMPEDTDTLRAILRWAAAALPFVGMAVLGRSRSSRGVGEVLAVFLTYGVIAQLAPTQALAWITAIGAIAVFLRWQEARSAAWAAALAIAVLWAVEPVFEWLLAGTEALMGAPFLADQAVSPIDIATRIAPTIAVLAVIAWKWSDQPVERRSPFLLGLGLLALIVVHSLFKQIFGIGSLLRFEHFGMAERSVWQALIMLGAYGAAQFLPTIYRRSVSLGLIGVSLAHFVWFTLILHNPLLSVQHVGPTPLANWLPVAYLTAIGGLWLARSQWEEAPRFIRPVFDAATMALIALLAYSLLRQIFAGSVLTATAVEQTESLLISLLGIVLALGFLWWGSWRQTRSWRIGSLVLMLAAVIKVFLIDAAGLEGLLRVASFMALGFSLIGIGWVYTKQLAKRSEPEG